jgi:hypothetical protein
LKNTFLQALDKFAMRIETRFLAEKVSSPVTVMITPQQIGMIVI